MKRTKPVRLWEQADSGRNGPIYSWILDAEYRHRGVLVPMGWKWVSGPEGGSYVTNSASLALATSRRLAVEIESNGTHEVIGVAMSNAACASA